MAVWFLKRTKRVAGRWPHPRSIEARAMHPGVPEGWNANNACISNAAPLSPRRGEGPLGPVSGGVATHRLPSCDASGISCRFPEGTQLVATRHLGRFLEGTQVVAGRWRFRDSPVRFRWETARNF